ncbi:MAG: chemotaxis protein CheA, partial [Proteobacteria bacterium]
MTKTIILDPEITHQLSELVNSVLNRLPLKANDIEAAQAISLDLATLKGGAEILSFDDLATLINEMDRAITEFSQAKIESGEASAHLSKCVTNALHLLDIRPVPTKAPAPSLSNPVPAAIAAPAAPTTVKKAEPAAIKVDAHNKTDDKENDTIRVNVALLSNLMNLVGELVLTKNQLQQASHLSTSDELTRGNQRLGVITAELQSEVMRTRMQPIGNALAKFQRLVRDTAKELGKSIELILEGTDTELDRTLVEAVKDPLTHIVRNALDHGLETPAERHTAGKSETGRIKIQSSQENGQVIIEVSDDGRGLSVDRIRAKVLEKNLVTPEQLSGLSDREIQSFIFLPGFSTAASVSNLSGRGVGMDVVKTNIERIGGTIELSSRLGLGTSIKLKIPLTLAILPALIVSNQGQKFAVPQSKLVELLRLEPNDGRAPAIEILQGVAVYRLRGNILPLINFQEILNPTQKGGDLTGETQNIVVVNSNGTLFGLIVDRIEDTADIVVKALPEFLRGIRIFSGAAILGDGSIALTVDINGLCEKTGLNQTVASPVAASAKSPKAVEIEYLGVDIGARGNCIFPLCLISRLEEFDTKDFRWSGERKFVLYRGETLPLIDVRKVLDIPSSLSREANAAKDKQTVVVVRLAEANYGLEVDAIVDLFVSAADLDVKMKDRPGIMGTLVDNNDVMIL